MEFDILGDVLIKSNDKTDPKYGCNPEERELGDYITNGVVNVDKPSGPTSHQVSSWVKEIFHLKKAGHSGTLDPKVTGCLPIALEDATKILPALLYAHKEYVCVMKLHDNVPEKKLSETFNYFKGEIYQRPPVKSSVKRVIRKRNIYYLDLMEQDGDLVLLRVGCEAGTYIRKLMHDMGLILGVGANMQELRRTKAGPFDEKTLVTLHDLKDAHEFYLEDGDESKLRQIIQPMERAVQHLGKIWVKDSAVSALAHGANLNAPGVVKLEAGLKENDVVAVFTLKDELVCLGKTLKPSDEIMKLKKGEVVDTQRVVMKPDAYPKMWHKSEEFKTQET